MLPTFVKESPIQEDTRVISLADYRRKRSGSSDDDSTPPSPCPLAARPVVERIRLETTPSRFWDVEPPLRRCRTN